MRSRSLDQFYDYVGKREKEQRPPATDGSSADALPGDVATGNDVPAPPSAHAPRKPRKTKPKEYGPTLAAPPPGFRYVVRGGVTVAVPLGDIGASDGLDDASDDALEAHDASQSRVRVYDTPEAPSEETNFEDEAGAELYEPHEATAYPAPARASDGDFADGFAEGEIVALWRRLPRHIQLLVGLAEPDQGEEIAQKYYTRGFKESRQQLVERLLDPTLTLEETARVLGVVPTTVRRYTNRGVLPCYRTVGQQRRFRLSDVLSFLEQEQKRQARKAARIAEKLANHQAALAANNGAAVVKVAPAPYRNGAA